MAWVIEHSPTTGADRLVLISIANHASVEPVDGAWEAWPGTDLIAFEARIAHVRTVQNVTARLAKAGAIERVINGAPDSRIPPDKRPNLYRIMLSHGVNCRDTRCCPGGVNPDAARGESPIPSGVNPQYAAGCTGDSPKTVIEPSGEPSVEPLRLVEIEVSAATIETETFDRFWSVYPRHVGKGAARKAWPAAIKAAGGTAWPIIEGAERFRDDPNRVDQFTPHPTTWLRAERWADDPLPPRGVPRGAPPPETIDDDRGGFEGVVEL